MKKILLFVLLILTLFGSSTFAWKKDVGLGIVLGVPSGITAKFWQSEETAIDAAATWGWGIMEVQGDYIWHRFDMVKVESGSLPLYIGAGAYAGFWTNGNWHGRAEVGLRMPIGLAYLFTDSPLEIFLEVAPSLSISPAVGLSVGGGIGARYYLGNN
ncbi:MAG: hypothetical protein WCJ46_02155 [bacterium]